MDDEYEAMIMIIKMQMMMIAVKSGEQPKWPHFTWDAGMGGAAAMPRIKSSLILISLQSRILASGKHGIFRDLCWCFSVAASGVWEFPPQGLNSRLKSWGCCTHPQSYSKRLKVRHNSGLLLLTHAHAK